MLPGRYKTQLIVAVLSCWWWPSTDALSGKHVCIEKQKYNLTKVIKVRAPVAVRSYEWCLAVPPRCERWHTELRDVTRLETEERSADIPVCCAGFAVRDERCVPRCPPGRMGHTCNIGCADGQWGASCTHQCICPRFSTCDPKDGKCICTEGWAGPSCDRKVDTVEVTHIPGLGLFNWKTEATSKIYSSSTSTRPITQMTTLPPTTTAGTSSPPTTTTAADLPLTITPAAVSSTTLTYTAVSSTPTSTTSNTPSTIKTTDTTFTAETQTKENIIIPQKNITRTLLNPRPTIKINESMVPATEMVTTNTRQTPTSATTVKATVKMGTSQTLNNVSITTTELPKLTSMTTDGPPKEIWIKPAQQEPEHITSVIGEGSLERGGTDDLLSLLSIVGGGMMAVILVAVFIVMMERCKKSQHGGSVMDKTEELDLKVAMQSHQGKSYVKSIFHSPLPEPPVYRDMKPVEQTNYMGKFSRPVVLHELSPALIDNFRGILESHYDHLPQRSSRPLSIIREQSYNSDLQPPSIGSLPNELCPIPNCQEHAHFHNRLYPVTESAIETLKLESDVPQADYANVEPLYAEIPCWRPQSHYANEVVNLNSEAVTEL